MRSYKYFKNKKKRIWIYQIENSESLLKNLIIMPRRIYNPKPLEQKPRNNIKLEDDHLKQKLVEKMINPFYFTDRRLNKAFNINLDSHQNNQAKS